MTRLQSPCPNDPFWDYYSLIGDISRVNGKELVRVANWIGADQVLRSFLQDWLSKRIRPLDLPNVLISTPYHRSKRDRFVGKINVRNDERENGAHFVIYDSQDEFGFVLSSASVVSLVKQCIKQQENGTSMESRLNHGIENAHPNAFELPGMAAQRRALSYGAHKFRAELEKQARKQHSKVTPTMKQRLGLFGFFAVFDLFDEESWDDFQNSVGCITLSCLDQQSFVAASLVCRAWFYCSRFAFARSHITLSAVCLFLFLVVSLIFGD